jgi:protein-disulfide isomerase
LSKKKDEVNVYSAATSVVTVIGVILILVLTIQVASIDAKVTEVRDFFTSIETDNADAVPAAGNQPSAAPSNNNNPTTDMDMEELIDDDAVKGDPNAPVTIVEWSDFECPFCTRFYTQTLGQIESEYIETGKVKFVYRDFPLGFHPNAQKAGEAAECAGEQGKYWEMHDKLFDDGVEGGVASFKQYASDLGLNTADFNNCLDSGAQAQEVKDDMAAGSAAGIRGTPGFVINGEIISGAQPFSVFKAAIDKALAE